MYSYDCKGRYGESSGLTVFNVISFVDIVDIPVYQYREKNKQLLDSVIFFQRTSSAVLVRCASALRIVLITILWSPLLDCFLRDSVSKKWSRGISSKLVGKVDISAQLFKALETH